MTKDLLVGKLNGERLIDGEAAVLMGDILTRCGWYDIISFQPDVPFTRRYK